MLFQNLLNTWWDHGIADSAQPRYRSIVTRPFSLLVRAGSGHETSSKPAVVYNTCVSQLRLCKLFKQEL